MAGFLIAGRPELAGKNYRRLNRRLLRLGICRVFAGHVRHLPTYVWSIVITCNFLSRSAYIY